MNFDITSLVLVFIHIVLSAVETVATKNPVAKALCGLSTVI